jgi:hypothetical protein
MLFPDIKLRAGNARCCECCGQRLQPKRGSRRQRFCNSRCRDEARRARNHAVFGTARRGSQAIPRSVENNRVKSNACNGHFDGQPPSICGPPDRIYKLHHGRSQRAIVRVVPCGALYRIEWPNIGPSPPANLSRCKDAARRWAGSLNSFWWSSSPIAPNSAGMVS